MLNWRDLVGLSDDELCSLDIAEVELACSVGLPGAEDLDVSACLERLDEWTESMHLATERSLRNWPNIPEYQGHSEALFRTIALTFGMQNRLGVHYDESFLEGEYDGRDSRNIFMHGIIMEGHASTCSNAPVLFTAIGRRFGYPLHLVKTTEHLFCRWDDPDGEVFNIECTGKGHSDHPDEYYHKWPKPIDERFVQQGVLMHSLTRRQETAMFLADRGLCLIENLRPAEAIEPLQHAVELDPNEPFQSARLQMAKSFQFAMTESRSRGTFNETYRDLQIPLPITLAERKNYSLACAELRKVTSRLGQQVPVETRELGFQIYVTPC